MWILAGDDQRQASLREAEAAMTDYKRIRLAHQGYRKLRAADTARFHSVQKSWLQNKLNEPFDGVNVVITHMAPSMRSVASQYEHALSSAAYASRLDELAAKAGRGYTGTCTSHSITPLADAGSCVIRAVT